MSVNKVNKSNGQLIALASGNRMWVGTHAAHLEAIANGTMPNNCIVAETDVSEFPTTEDIIEANALANLGTAANATQQTINSAINTKIGSLQSQITSNDTDIANLQTTDTSLQNQISSNDTDIQNLQTAAGSLQRQISSNDTDISNLNAALNSIKLSTTTVYASNYRNYTTIEGRYSDWVGGEIYPPDIPSGYIALRYFAQVTDVSDGYVAAFPLYVSTASAPNHVGIITDGQVCTCKLRLAAVCVKIEK